MPRRHDLRPEATPVVDLTAIITLPSLELTESYSLDENFLTTAPKLASKIADTFDQTFPSEDPFEFDDLCFYPELNSDDDATTFGQVLPPNQRKVAMIVRPSPRHRDLIERLKVDMELERRQHELIMEEAMETAGNQTNPASSTTKKKKKKKSKTAQGKTQGGDGSDDLMAALDRRLSALETDNIELKKSNVELMHTVTRHWASISALNRRSLLDSARLSLLSDYDLSLKTLYTDFRENPLQTANTLHERLSPATQEILSPYAVMMIFGFECPQTSMGHRRPRNIASQTVRGKGNAAAHQLDPHDASAAVLQVDLSENDRSSLNEVYTFVFGKCPSFEV